MGCGDVRSTAISVIKIAFQYVGLIITKAISNQSGLSTIIYNMNWITMENNDRLLTLSYKGSGFGGVFHLKFNAV